ncbi:MAG TPA: Stf0 family sulfotransferase [Coleofasciculaceae cyanobacterium]|jgi:LPS sulfotransferase NodH
MELAKIFQAVEETQLLKRLSAEERLFLVGDFASLEYIKNFFSDYQQADRNYYYDLSTNQLADLRKAVPDFQLYQAVVVVSLKDEAALLPAVKQQVSQLTSELTVLGLFSDIFINLLCHRPLLKTSSLHTQRPQKSYAIVTTPRSGSTYLCDLLDSTKIAGHPLEHLRLAAQELSRYCNFNYLKLLDNLMEYRITDNGVFGTKFISHFLFEFQQTKPDFREIFQSIDRFILLVRKDKLAQAVSLVLAQKTNVWHLRNNAKNSTNYQSKLENIKIDDVLLDEVAQKCDFIKKQEARLKRVLADNQIESLLIIYEDILEDPQLEINRILDFLAIAKPDPYIMQINSGIKRMPSGISQKIMRQFHQRKSIVC